MLHRDSCLGVEGEDPGLAGVEVEGVTTHSNGAPMITKEHNKNQRPSRCPPVT